MGPRIRALCDYRADGRPHQLAGGNCDSFRHEPAFGRLLLRMRSPSAHPNATRAAGRLASIVHRADEGRIPRYSSGERCRRRLLASRRPDAGLRSLSDRLGDVSALNPIQLLGPVSPMGPSRNGATSENISKLSWLVLAIMLAKVGTRDCSR